MLLCYINNIIIVITFPVQDFQYGVSGEKCGLSPSSSNPVVTAAEETDGQPVNNKQTTKQKGEQQ